MNIQISGIIRQSTITADSVTLPPGQLDRTLYLEVNKVLTDAGGKWNRKAKAHLFARDPREALQKFLVTGESVNLKKEAQAFYSPPAVAQRVVELARVKDCRVLEPSAGEGALVKECFRQGAIGVHAIEYDKVSVQVLGALEVSSTYPLTVCQCDFLTLKPADKYERIVMNPPFTRNAWKKHLCHALNNWLPKNGMLSCVVPDVASQISELLEPLGFYYEIFPLPAGSFKASGTMINTAIVVVHK
ncbi:MAG: RsmD family RNA methyltransferase [Verrucomicrobiales bacterium]|jgi:hypothetical protein|nr:RsmD family RNA methyltransferase [Verrucomicrobiales bacterium]